MPAPAATKWGINGWSESLRQELLPDVWVTVIEPGVLATELPSPITHANTKQGVGTGVGTGEALALAWKDVDLTAAGEPHAAQS
jgi:NADP-dependent 3-hydroxy acid dehydrogenase YdfG